MFPIVKNKVFTAWMIFALTVASTGIYSLVTAPSAEASVAFSIKSGSYNGNGSSLSVSGLGFRPEVVTIKSGASLNLMWKSSAMPATLASGSTGSEIILGADGFTVSPDPEVNTASVSYTYTAFAGSDCSSGGVMCVGSYTGDGTASRVITTGFQPSLVWTKRTTTLLGDGSSGWLLATVSGTTTGSFTVGLTDNRNGDVYYYAAFQGIPAQLPVYQSAGYGTSIFSPVPAPSTELSAKFRVGDRVRVTQGVNVRTTPSTAGTLLGTQSIGILGIIVSGPSAANGYNWYQINFDSGVDGWSIEDVLELSSAPAPEPTASGGDGDTGSTGPSAPTGVGAPGVSGDAAPPDGPDATGGAVTGTPTGGVGAPDVGSNAPPDGPDATGGTGTAPSCSDTSSGFSFSNAVSFGINNSVTGVALSAVGLGTGPTSDAAFGLNIALAIAALALGPFGLALGVVSIADAAFNGAISSAINAAFGGALAALGNLATSAINGVRGFFGFGPMGARGGGNDPDDTGLTPADIDTAVTAEQGETGETGETGDTGVSGPTGPTSGQSGEPGGPPGDAGTSGGAGAGGGAAGGGPGDGAGAGDGPGGAGSAGGAP